jgi:hypothetical protein
MFGRGKILGVVKLGKDRWNYSLWNEEAGLHELVIQERTHFEIIEKEGEIVGRDIIFKIDEKNKEIMLMFDDEPENEQKNNGS